MDTNPTLTETDASEGRPQRTQRKEEKNKGRKSVDVRNKESERRGLEMVRETSLTGQQKRSTNEHLAGVEKEVEGETGQRKGMRRLGRLDKDKEANRNTEREREQRIMELEAEWERWEKGVEEGGTRERGFPSPSGGPDGSVLEPALTGEPLP